MLDRVTVEPDKMDGQPCVRGRRLTVAHLLRLVADGWTLEQIQEDFPFVEQEDLHQALLYAAEVTEAVTLPRREPA